MIEAFFILKIFTCLAAVVLTCAIVSRDPGIRINWLMGAVPFLVGLWTLGELICSLQPGFEQAESLIRLTSGTWLLIGPAALHVFAELAGSRRPGAGRLVSISYAVSLFAFATHLKTGLGLERMTRTAWGYGFELNAAFIPIYLTLVVPLAYVLIVGGSILPQSESAAERRGWYSLYISVFAVVGFATFTDIILPTMGVQSLPVGGTCVMVVLFGIAVQFRRYGYALMAPGTFATQILDSLNDGVVMLRHGGKVRTANDAFNRLVDATSSEVRGVHFSRFVHAFGSDLPMVSGELECELISCKGTAIPVLISPTPLQNPSGNFCGMALVVRDLREVSALRGSLVASDRLATVGGLSASIAEEIREPTHEMRCHLEGIRGRLTCLLDIAQQCESTEKLDELLSDREELIEECLEGIDRIEAIVRDVRGFAGDTSGKFESVDINALVEDALRIAMVRAGAEVRVEKKFDALSEVPCMPREIVQVLVNLLVNAIHATGGTGRVQVSTWQEDQEIWVCIEDNGQGVSREVLPRIFDPFFTTKPVGDGTGLGLAISHHIVRNHGGDLRVESEEGRGARFTLVLRVDPNARAKEGTVSELLSR